MIPEKIVDKLVYCYNFNLVEIIIQFLNTRKSRVDLQYYILKGREECYKMVLAYESVDEILKCDH